MYSPYDFNQSIAHRAEYVEERIKHGSPVVGVSYAAGMLFFSVTHSQRKIYEIYDQLMYSAIGNQADVEAVRLASIDFAHQEGFQRSPDDVSIQRLVGFAISPAIKRSFVDPMSAPHVLRAMFGEVGRTPEKDSYFVVHYDGEFTMHTKVAVVAGSRSTEEAMREAADKLEGVPDLTAALQFAVDTWRLGSLPPTHQDDEDNDQAAASTADEPVDPLTDALKHGHIEAAVLERDSPRESRFRLLRADELQGLAPSSATSEPRT